MFTQKMNSTSSASRRNRNRSLSAISYPVPDLQQFYNQLCQRFCIPAFPLQPSLYQALSPTLPNLFQRSSFPAMNRFPVTSPVLHSWTQHKLGPFSIVNNFWMMNAANSMGLLGPAPPQALQTTNPGTFSYPFQPTMPRATVLNTLAVGVQGFEINPQDCPIQNSNLPIPLHHQNWSFGSSANLPTEDVTGSSQKCVLQITNDGSNAKEGQQSTSGNNFQKDREGDGGLSQKLKDRLFRKRPLSDFADAFQPKAKRRCQGILSEGTYSKPVSNDGRISDIV